MESADLELLGLTPQTERSLGTFQIICGGWNICNSWAGIVGTLAIGISEGGTVLLLYGIILITVFGGCFTSTLAELASVYPTAGGQYHWTSILSPKKYSRTLVRLWPSGSSSAIHSQIFRAIGAVPSTSSVGSRQVLVLRFFQLSSLFPWSSITIQTTRQRLGIISWFIKLLTSWCYCTISLLFEGPRGFMMSDVSDIVTKFSSNS